MHTPIHPNTTMGAVALTVADLDRSLAYYQQQIGLALLQGSAEGALLGAGERVLLRLTAQPGAHPVQQRRTGLYHFALLVPSRLELARTLNHLLTTKTPISGASDHHVSEALYLSDPDGHGIEIYRDRPRLEWEYPNGWLRMGTDPFDGEGVLGELTGHEPAWVGIHPATVMGHMHLHVAQIAASEQFYGGVLGFDRMASYGGQASFMAAGGYHHHLGLNTWAGVGAPPPPTDAARLLWYEIHLPDAAALAATLNRVREANLPVSEQAEGWLLHDPAQNAILLKTGQ
jgi:catechol 2,3-dioxygenase